jgi:hypothetical protein
MRSRTRRLLGEILIAGAVLAACGSHSGANRRIQSTGPAGRSKGEQFPYIAPTAAAIAAIAGYRLDRTGHDCGGRASDQGFPTTAAPSTTTTCLRDADRATEKAFMIFTGRDGYGGALLTSYRTEGGGSLSVLDLYADPKGKMQTTRWACAVPRDSVALSIGFGGIGHEVVEPISGCRRSSR